MRKAFFSLFLVAFPLTALGMSACSDGLPDEPTPAADASVDRARRASPVIVDASCGAILIEDHPLLDSPHVAIDTVVTYNSNPPTSGPHYPVWAAYQEYDKPVDRRYYVHDLEHGGVVLAYNCQAAGDAGAATACNQIIEGLRKAIAAIPNDPLCDGEGVRVRAVLTPDPLLDVPIAAAAWGQTYRAQCLDLPSLIDFVKTSYGFGPESLCANGQPMF